MDINNSRMRFFLGIGSQKGGTTWLHKILVNHKEIYLPPINELHFFDELELQIMSPFKRIFSKDWRDIVLVP